VGEAQADDQLRVLPAAQHVRLSARGLEAPHRRLEVVARTRQLAGPVGGDPADVVALDPQDLIAVTLSASAQPFAEAARRPPVAACEGGQCERPDQRRLGLAAELLGALEGARVHLFHALGPVPLVRDQRRRQRREQPQLQLRGVRTGRQVVGQRQCALERADRIGMRVQPLGGLRRPRLPADRLGRRAGVLVVQRKSRPRRRRRSARALARSRRGPGACEAG
jgi:hypothetical protein